MGFRKVYMSDIDLDATELNIFKNADGNLFINLSPFPDTHSSDVSIVLNKEDAIDIILDLLDDFDMYVENNRGVRLLKYKQGKVKQLKIQTDEQDNEAKHS